MHTALVRLRLPDGGEVTLGPGDLIGRLPGLALQLNDPRISEVHALVSLRGEELKLLSLRGMLGVAGRPRTEAVLQPGLEVTLARGLELVVEEVALPPRVLGLRLDGGDFVLLQRSACYVVTSPTPRVVHKYANDAAATIWRAGLECWIQLRDQEPAPFEAGGTWEVEGTWIEAAMVPLARAQARETAQEGRLFPPTRVVARHDTLSLLPQGRPVVVIGGMPSKLVGELVAMGGTGQWRVVAGELWPGEEDDWVLRHRWDKTLRSLRKKLRDAGLRENLVSSTGSGCVELVLGDADTLVDEV